jgi:chaperone modulatory protein CbpM
MIGVETIYLEFRDLAPAELERWIDNAWIRPRGRPGAWAFEEIDVARIRLISELRDTMEVTEAALPTVLSLVDQLYALRRRMRRLNQAMAAGLPAEAVALLAAAMEEE